MRQLRGHHRCRLLAAAGISAVALALPATASADTFTINDDTTGPGPAGATCDTPDFTGANPLQDAIDAANPGETLLVCAGTYSNPAGGQPAANVTKSLSILGAQEGVDARDRAVPPADESTLDDPDGDFALNATDVNIDGFNVTGVTGALGAGINVPASTNDHRIANNIVSGNVIGINLNGAGAETLVRRNLITDNNEPGAASGTGIYSAQGLSNVEIDENVFSDHLNAAMTLNAGLVSGSEIAITRNDVIDDGAILLANTADLLIEGNTSSESAGHGIQLDGGNRDVEISGNTLEDAAAGFSAVQVSDDNGFGPNSGVDVTGNTLTGDGDEFGVRVSDGAHSGQLDVRFNRIVGNLTGVSGEDPTDPVDAENNWWGCNEGPGNPDCDPTGGSVDADPNLVISVSAARATLRRGKTTTVTATLQRNSDGEVFSPSRFPDGTLVLFTASKGTVTPSQVPSAGGIARSTYKAARRGIATIAAALDNETATTTVRVKRKRRPPVF